ncbi:MAG: hypothetical protein J6W73_08515, partial [Verrucomicrobia bacterium]|nr:hypothetical protein [Verrucomicrobiota bacterium]
HGDTGAFDVEYQMDVDFYQCRCHILMFCHRFPVRLDIVTLPGVTLRSPPAIIISPLTGFQSESLRDFITRKIGGRVLCIYSAFH